MFVRRCRSLICCFCEKTVNFLIWKMTYGNQSCFERCLDKFDSAVAFLLQKNNGRNTSNMYNLDDWFSLFVSWFGYKGENTIHASQHSGFHSSEHDALGERICRHSFKEIMTTTTLVTNIWWKTTQISHRSRHTYIKIPRSL